MSSSGSGTAKAAGEEYRKPSGEVIKKAGEVTVYNAEAEPVLFKSLYDARGQGKRVLILFIRHFFCGVCQEYLKALAAGISPTSLPQDVSIVIIGCGAPSLIPSYVENLGFEKSYPFPIYADQSKELYSLFEMQSNLDIPSMPAKYFQRSIFAVLARTAVQISRRSWHGDATSGGPISQNGGEFLFAVEGDKVEVPWCHRMKNTGDHAEIDELRTVLSLDEKVTPTT